MSDMLITALDNLYERSRDKVNYHFVLQILHEQSEKVLLNYFDLFELNAQLRDNCLVSPFDFVTGEESDPVTTDVMHELVNCSTVCRVPSSYFLPGLPVGVSSWMDDDALSKGLHPTLPCFDSEGSISYALCGNLLFTGFNNGIVCGMSLEMVKDVARYVRTVYAPYCRFKFGRLQEGKREF